MRPLSTRPNWLSEGIMLVGMFLGEAPMAHKRKFLQSSKRVGSSAGATESEASLSKTSGSAGQPNASWYWKNSALEIGEEKQPPPHDVANFATLVSFSAMALSLQSW